MESIKINKLKETLEKGKYEELEIFLETLKENGSPIIETIEGDNDNSLVTYIYNGDEDTKNVVVVQPIGNRNPIDNMMNKVLDTNLWYKTYKVRNDVRFRYYFSINDDLGDNLAKRLKSGVCDKFNNNKLVFGDGHIISYVVMNKAENHRSFNELDNKHRGTLKKYELFSKTLNEIRNIWIYTPNQYDSICSDVGIGVFTDGNEHINILKTKDILDNMIHEKSIKSMLGVFIESTENRGKELRCNEEFERFVVSELIPWIKDNYKVSEDREDNVICGFSLGGLTALYIALKHPNIFGSVVSQSGAYHAGMESIEKEICSCEDKLKCYINVGILEDEKIMKSNNNRVANLLKDKGHFVYYDIFKSGHDYLCWGQGLWTGLNKVMK